jgi:hypothetical protein
MYGRADDDAATGGEAGAAARPGADDDETRGKATGASGGPPL